MRQFLPGKTQLAWWPVLLIILAGCAAPQVSEARITVQLVADGKQGSVDLPAGSTADEALKAGGILLDPLDRTDPPLYTVLGEGSQVKVVRVKEEFIVEQEVIPFESQVVRNESLPAGQEYWLQLGQNGVNEITIRKVFEDGEQVSSSRIKSVVVKEAIPQIKMVGVLKSFAPFPIPGRLAFLVDGNAWVMERTTGNRRQVVDTGDLDGRIFSLSPDRAWLLYTRSSQADDSINSLWAAPVGEDAGDPIDLGIENVVHFADWKPGSVLTIAFSTVEPRPGAPGWQANNDLRQLTFSSTGFIRELPVVLEANSGGLYGWWGTNFCWAPDGSQLGYARPDEIGWVDLQTNTQIPLVEFTPLQTLGDWAWVPGIAWDPEGSKLYSVEHASPAESQVFDLIVTATDASPFVPLTPGVGMFAYPVPSPLEELPSGERAYKVAYLQALFPSQSETSRYQLTVMDRDGSNRTILFPVEGTGGLEAQRVVWSPEKLEDAQALALAVIYEGNLWLVDSERGEAWQITGDGLTSRVDWK
jgi:hypothetical protein